MKEEQPTTRRAHQSGDGVKAYQLSSGQRAASKFLHKEKFQVENLDSPVTKNALREKVNNMNKQQNLTPNLSSEDNLDTFMNEEAAISFNKNTL